VLDVGNQGRGINYIQTGLTRSQVGEPVGQWYLIRSLGLFQSQEEINNHKNKDNVVIQPSAKPGDVKYEDKNGDGRITADDRQFVGSPLAETANRCPVQRVVQRDYIQPPTGRHFWLPVVQRCVPHSGERPEQ
jgi:hypothetical protein